MKKAPLGTFKAEASKESTFIVQLYDFDSAVMFIRYPCCFLQVQTDELGEMSLELAVWDHDRFSSNELLGLVRLNSGKGQCAVIAA